MLKIYFLFYMHGCWIMIAGSSLGLGGCHWGVLTRLLGSRRCWISLRWLMLSGPYMHHAETSNLWRTKHCTLASSKLGHTCSHIYRKGFWGSSGTYRGSPWTHPRILLHMRSVVRHGRSESNMWWQWAKLFHIGLHGPALQTTCLGITRIHIHTWFHHRREGHHMVLYVFHLSLVVVRYHIMFYFFNEIIINCIVKYLCRIDSKWCQCPRRDY